MGINLLYTRPEPIPQPQKFQNPQAPRTLFEYARPIRRRWLLGLCVAVLAVSLDLVIPQILSFIVNELLTKSPSYQMVWLGGGLVLLVGLVRMSLVWTRRSLLIDPTSTIENTMRLSLFDKFMRSPISFHDHWPSGQLLQRTMADLGNIRRWLAFGIIQSLATLFMLIVGLVLLAQGSLTLAGIYAASVPFLWLSLWFFVRKYRKLTRATQELAGALSTTVEESVQGIRVLKALGRSDHAHAGFTAQSVELRDLEVERAQALGLVFVRNFTVIGITMLVSLYVGIHQVVHNNLSVGQLTAYFATVAILNTQIERCGMLLSMGLTAKVAMDRHREVIDSPDLEDLELTQVPEKSTAQGPLALTFEKVSFAYEKDAPPILKDFSLQVQPGEIIALIGATGCGKSTVLQLVPQLYQADTGRILFDSIDTSDLPLADVRAQVAFAFEEPVLFSSSVRENILLGVNTCELSEEDQLALLEDALTASASDFVAGLPDGVDSIIGEEGMSLSGGQRQRLSLARAIASQPRLLLLDDPLSALDVTTEQYVVGQLKERLQATTTLLTAHRPSTVSLADRVAIMDQGTIVAIDTPQQIKSHPLYQELMTTPEEGAQHGQ